MSDNQYKLDRTHVTKMSFKEADDHTTWKKLAVSLVHNRTI